MKYHKKNLKLDLKSPWRILYKASNFKLSNYDPELKCAFFSKNWWFSVQKLRVSTFQISKKAHLSTVHDKKFSTWGIPYIYLRECPLMNLNEKLVSSFQMRLFASPMKNEKIKNLWNELGFQRKNVGIVEKRAHLSFKYLFFLLKTQVY